MKQIKILFNNIFGFVTIVVEGYFIEKFINICIKKGILIWDIDREKFCILKAKIGIGDFKKIRQIAKTTKCKVSIANKKGLPFLFARYKKRKIFVACIAIVSAFIVFSSTFIWNVEIIGESKLSKKDIVKTLEESGFKVGMRKKDIDKTQVLSNFRYLRDDVSWIGMNIRGTNAIIEVVDVSPKPEVLNPNEICSIISDKQGVITNVIVNEGTPYVQIGDIVEKGMLLVGGWMEGKYTGTRYVHAEATIEATIWYSKKEKIYLKNQEKVRNGEEEKKYALNLNNFKINFYKTVTKFKSYDTMSEENKLKIFSNIYLPISITKTTNYELNTVDVTYTIEQAKAIGVEKLGKELLDNIPEHENILNKQINYYEQNEYIEVELIYEVHEKIGAKEKINFNVENE